MSLSINRGGDSASNIRDCLIDYGISSQDYDDLINALFLAAPKDPAAHAEVKFDRKDTPIFTTSVSRVFNSVAITAEDRGAVYAVWVNKIDEDRGTKDIVGFTQLPWGQL